MKYITSKLIQKAEGNKTGRYQLAIELTDYDIEMFEEFGQYPTAIVTHQIPEEEYVRMNKYLHNIYHRIFQRIWRKHD